MEQGNDKEIRGGLGAYLLGMSIRIGVVLVSITTLAITMRAIVVYAIESRWDVRWETEVAILQDLRSVLSFVLLKFLIWHYWEGDPRPELRRASHVVSSRTFLWMAWHGLWCVLAFIGFQLSALYPNGGLLVSQVFDLTRANFQYWVQYLALTIPMVYLAIRLTNSSTLQTSGDNVQFRMIDMAMLTTGIAVFLAIWRIDSKPNDFPNAFSVGPGVLLLLLKSVLLDVVVLAGLHQMVKARRPVWFTVLILLAIELALDMLLQLGIAFTEPNAMPAITEHFSLLGNRIITTTFQLTCLTMLVRCLPIRNSK